MTKEASFSDKVKRELKDVMPKGSDNMMSELYAIMSEIGKVSYENEKYAFLLETDSPWTARKGFTLLKKSFNIRVDIRLKMRKRSETYALFSSGSESDQKLKDLICSVVENNIPGLCYKDMETKRAFLRGLFLASGSVNDPKGSNHFQITLKKEDPEKVLDIIRDFGIRAKTGRAGSKEIIYIKDGAGISEMLNVLGASVSMMEFENRRILKGVLNSVNRQMNCDAANINKTMDAFNRQSADILFLKEINDFDSLPEKLKELAEIRLMYPEASLEDLGKMLDVPVGKSGVNHRLRRICERAEKRRQEIALGE